MKQYESNIISVAGVDFPPNGGELVQLKPDSVLIRARTKISMDNRSALADLVIGL
jgi:hypothetical protein